MDHCPMLRLHTYVSVCLVATLTCTTSSAHHSRSEFSSDVTELRGTLTKVHWRNPHAGLDITVVNDDGEEETWRVETFGSPNLFGRMGVEREYFNVGEEIVVSGSISERRDHYMLGTNVLFESGLEAILNATMGPTWSDTYVGGAEFSDRDLSTLVDAAAENKGIYRNWSIAGRSIGVSRHFPYTEESRAAQRAADPLKSPIINCETPGMPMPMFQPLSFEFVDEGATARLNVEYFGIVRTIHLEDTVDPATVAPSPLGYSVGHWEGNTLVVETSRINYPYFNGSGVRQSENVHVVERFELSEDQTHLNLHMTITDAMTFTAPATAGRTYIALGEQFVPLDCTVF
jgi:hypothetical protein